MDNVKNGIPCYLLQAEDFSEDNLENTYFSVTAADGSTYFLVAPEIPLTKAWQDLHSVCPQGEEGTLARLHMASDFVFPSEVMTKDEEGTATTLSEVLSLLPWSEGTFTGDEELLLVDAGLDEATAQQAVCTFAQQMIYLRLPLLLQRQSIKYHMTQKASLAEQWMELKAAAEDEKHHLAAIQAEMQTDEGRQYAKALAQHLEHVMSCAQEADKQECCVALIGDAARIQVLSDELAQAGIHCVAAGEAKACCAVYVYAGQEDDAELSACAAHCQAAGQPLIIAVEQSLDDTTTMQDITTFTTRYAGTLACPVDLTLLNAWREDKDSYEVMMAGDRIAERYQAPLTKESIALYAGIWQLAQAIRGAALQSSSNCFRKEVLESAQTLRAAMEGTANPIQQACQAQRGRAEAVRADMVNSREAVRAARSKLGEACILDAVKARLFDRARDKDTAALALSRQVLKDLAPDADMAELADRMATVWAKHRPEDLVSSYAGHVRKAVASVQQEMAVLAGQLTGEAPFLTAAELSAAPSLPEDTQTEDDGYREAPDFAAMLEKLLSGQVLSVAWPDDTGNAIQIHGPLTLVSGLEDDVATIFASQSEAGQADDILSACKTMREACLAYRDQLAEAFRHLHGELIEHQATHLGQARQLAQDQKAWQQAQGAGNAFWRLWQDIFAKEA